MWPTFDQDLTNVMVKSSPKSAWSSNQVLTKIRPTILGQGSECWDYSFKEYLGTILDMTCGIVINCGQFYR